MDKPYMHCITFKSKHNNIQNHLLEVHVIQIKIVIKVNHGINIYFQMKIL